MLAAVMQRHGGSEALVVRQAPKPSPSSGEVLVRVLAAGVNNTDIWTREGSYGTPGDPAATAGWKGVPIDTPRIQGADVVGVIEDVGKGTDAARVGERVLIDPATYADGGADADPVAILGSEYDGGFAEYCVVDSDHAHDVSASPLTDRELACLPIAYGTAAGMLSRAEAGADETVVVTGASGGVGVALVQLASALGLRVLAVSTPDKADALVGMGASAVFDRGSSSLPDDVRSAAPGGVDLVADVVGGPLFSGWPGLIRDHGRIVVAGGFAGPVVTLDLRRLYLGHKRILGSTMHTRQHFARLVELARTGAVRPPIAQAFPLMDIHAAQSAIRDATTIGKIVLDVSV